MPSNNYDGRGHTVKFFRGEIRQDVDQVVGNDGSVVAVRKAGLVGCSSLSKGHHKADG